jgi:hypothetical protein
MITPISTAASGSRDSNQHQLVMAAGIEGLAGIHQEATAADYANAAEPLALGVVREDLGGIR